MMIDENEKTATILYVEDENDIRDGYAKALARCCKELYCARDAKEAIKLFDAYNPDIVITDINMPNMNGIEMVKIFKEKKSNISIVFTTAYSDSSYFIEAIELQAEGYFLKPVSSKKLKEKIISISKRIFLENINKEQVQKIKEQKELLQNIINTEKNMSIVTDFSKISFANSAFLDFIGVCNIEQFYEKYNHFLDIFNKEDGYLHSDLLANNSEKEYSSSGFFDLIESTISSKRIVSINNANAEAKYFYVGVSELLKNKKLHLMTLTDITQLAQEKKDTYKKAYIDQLTGIWNRNKFKEIFEQEVKKSKLNKIPLSLAIIDIDNFKKYNDTYGHLCGDMILKSLAKNVNAHIRKSDLFARWGGEEFVVVFIHTNLQDSIKASQILRHNIENSDFQDNMKITVSIGVTEFRDNDSIESIFKRCDKALYLSKQNGKNCVTSL